MKMVGTWVLLALVCVALVTAEVPGGEHGGHDQCVCTKNDHYIRTSFNQTCKEGSMQAVQLKLGYVHAEVIQVCIAT